MEITNKEAVLRLQKLLTEVADKDRLKRLYLLKKLRVFEQRLEEELLIK